MTSDENGAAVQAAAGSDAAGKLLARKLSACRDGHWIQGTFAGAAVTGIMLLAACGTGESGAAEESSSAVGSGTAGEPSAAVGSDMASGDDVPLDLEAILQACSSGEQRDGGRPDDLALPPVTASAGQHASCYPREDAYGYATFEEWMGSVDAFIVGTILDVRLVDEVRSDDQPYVELPAGACASPSDWRPVEMTLGDVESAFGHDEPTALLRLRATNLGRLPEHFSPGLRVGGGFHRGPDGHSWFMAMDDRYQPLFEVYDETVWFQSVPDLEEHRVSRPFGCGYWAPRVEDLDALAEDELMRRTRSTREAVGERREGNRLWEFVTYHARSTERANNYFRMCQQTPPPPPSMADVECRDLDMSCIEDPFAQDCPGHPGTMHCHCYYDDDCDPIFEAPMRCEDERCVRD